MTTLAPSVTPAKNGMNAARLDSPTAKAGAARWAAYFEIAKPGIAFMVLLSVAVGYVLGSQGTWRVDRLLHTCFGVFLAVMSSSAFNQYLERETDARMPRTWKRPLPTLRLSAPEVLLVAALCGLVSFTYLLITVNALTAWLTTATIVLYAGCYTPLKRYTSLCTVVGAVPGALPPVLGWTAAGGHLDAAAFSLFAILFLWQFPHFSAIAWMYRDQYEQAGLKMVPGNGRAGVIGSIAVGYSLVLIPVSLLSVHWKLCGDLYGILAVALGLMYAAAAVWFRCAETRSRARQLLWTSLVYLPTLLLALVLDHLRLLS